jgi:hypothetical protein
MNLVRGVIVVGAILMLPVLGYAQEAVVSGVVTDTTGGVLPGVTITARHVATGNVFVAVTDERGAFRLGVRTGGYELVAELQGFATLARSGLELLVGQTVAVNLQMTPASLQESVTVTAEAPLIDTTSSTVAGNIDPRQMQNLPIQGRSWQDLAMLAPGARRNESGDSPTVRNRRDFHINLDGQQTTSILVQGGGTGTGAADQPLYSQDAIAEFQFISARFDATQGRSIGTQVNAVTKSGTNTPSGSFAGYFRDDRFKAKDFVTGTVLPYSNQQLSGTFGGPIRRDRLHLFGNYEWEREPGTTAYTTPFPAFNIQLPNDRKQKMAGARVDWQLSPQSRLMARGNYGVEVIPNEGANLGSNHPSNATEFRRHNDEIFTTLTQVLGDRALNELKGGFASFYYYNYSVVRWPGHPMAASQGVTIGTPRITFTGFTVGPAANNPQLLGQTVWSIRDDFTYSFNARGRHDVKLGGEYLYLDGYTSNCRGCQGQYDAAGSRPPANIEAILPVWNDVSTWNLDALSPLIRRYDVTVGTLQTYQRRDTFGGWFQDNWAMTNRLTLNLGIRYDLALGQLANDIAIPPFLEAGRPNDKNNFGPRAGLTYSVTDRTVLRGGYGVYFGELANTMTSRTQSWTQLTGATVENTTPRRANFGSSPFDGPIPTYDQAQQRYCHRSNVPGCLREGLEQIIDPKAKVMYSHQASAGFQRQLGSTMAVEADYTYQGERNGFYSHRMNLTYDPVTGVNYPFSDISRRAYPLYAGLGIERLARRSNSQGLQSAWTKRFSDRWSSSATYTLAWYKDAQAPPLSGLEQVTFPVAPDLGGEYSLAEGDQRHRAVFNGIWEVGYGFQVSGLYFFGSGMRRSTNWGGDLRQTGSTEQGGRLRPNGTVVPRNNFVGDPLHRVDMRLQRRFRFGGRTAVDGMLEIYNVFNHANYGSYVTSESNARYGLPNQNTNVAYQPRTLQLGFRTTF